MTATLRYAGIYFSRLENPIKTPVEGIKVWICCWVYLKIYNWFWNLKSFWLRFASSVINLVELLQEKRLNVNDEEEEVIIDSTTPLPSRLPGLTPPPRREDPHMLYGRFSTGGIRIFREYFFWKIFFFKKRRFSVVWSEEFSVHVLFFLEIS